MSKWNKLQTKNRLGKKVFHPSTIRILPEINLVILFLILAIVRSAEESILILSESKN